MFDTIMVPLDGSSRAEAALAVAELIPSRQIRLLNVRSDVTQLEAICKSAHDGQAYLERVAEPLRRQGRTVTVDVVFGDARRQIVAFSALADLVVIGSRGCGASSAFFLGSVADWVARHAPVPTLIVRGGEKPATTSPLTRLVVPLDGSTLAEAALPMASMLAADLGLPIRLVRVVDFDLVRASVGAGMEAAQDSAKSQGDAVRLAQDYLAGRVQRLRDENLIVTSDVRTGSPVAALLDTISVGDLVVLTTRERGGLARWLLGSVAVELVRHAAGAVLLVRAPTPSRPDQPSPAAATAETPAGALTETTRSAR